MGGVIDKVQERLKTAWHLFFEGGRKGKGVREEVGKESFIALPEHLQVPW